MDDSLKIKITALCEELTERGVLGVIGLAMGPECSWTSFLVIGTVTSRVHMQGAAKAAGDILKSMGLECSGGKKSEETSWYIMDGGEVVISLMDAEARKFYALEELWYESEIIYDERISKKETDHSSNNAS